jgi:GT2 family glycosyltransferase
MRRVALVIVHYRTIADTLECLESALRLQVPDGTTNRIVIVDNASGDSSWNRLVEWASRRRLFWHARFPQSRYPHGIDQALGFRFTGCGPEVVLLRAEENRGYAAGVNLGVKFALDDPFTTDCWVLNSDLVFQSDSLLHLLNASKDRPLGIYGATLLYDDDPEAIQAAGGAFYWRTLGRSRHFGKGKKITEFESRAAGFDYIVGAAMFFPREVIDCVGLLPEHFFLYFEETEWCARARELGVELVWVPESRIIHKEGKSTGAAARFRRLSDLSFRYVVRNSLLYSESRHPLFLPMVFLYNLFECSRYWLSGDRSKVQVFAQAVRDYLSTRSILRSCS